VQRVLNAAARVVSGTHKFDRGLSRLLHTELHWLDVPERVVYNLNWRHGVQLPAPSSACVPHGIVPTSRRCHIAATSPIHHPRGESSWSYRVTGSAAVADGLSEWLVRRSGIPFRTACGIRLLAETVSENIWRRFCPQRTDAFSALEVLRRCAIQVDFLLTYLLT